MTRLNTLKVIAIILMVFSYASKFFLPFHIFWFVHMLFSCFAIGLYAKSKGFNILWMYFGYTVLDIIIFGILIFLKEKKTPRIVHSSYLGMMLVLVGGLLIGWQLYMTLPQSHSPWFFDHGRGLSFELFSFAGLLIIFKGIDLSFMQWFANPNLPLDDSVRISKS